MVPRRSSVRLPRLHHTIVSDRPLLERAAELAELDAALRAAESGTTRTVVVRGEPGIGKSSLLAAAATRAAELGFAVRRATFTVVSRRTANGLLWEWFGVPRSRWIYGLPGVFIAQLLAFTPIAFLVLIGVVQGISPTLEEASQTLRAKSWTTFLTVTLPLMRPGLANAFLLGFVESLADFGNPLVLGGNYEVLSTKIFFAVVGAQQDQGRAAVLSIILLAFTLGAFWLQHAWLGKKVYTTVTGKGDAGIPLPLPRRVALASYLTAIPWALFTVVVYVIIVVGAFVRSMGRDYTPTLEHFLTAFRVERADWGFYFSGSAWNSFFATVKVAALSAVTAHSSPATSSRSTPVRSSRAGTATPRSPSCSTTRRGPTSSLNGGCCLR